MANLITSLIIVEDLVTVLHLIWYLLPGISKTMRMFQHSCATEAGEGAPSSRGVVPGVLPAWLGLWGKGPGSHSALYWHYWVFVTVLFSPCVLLPVGRPWSWNCRPQPPPSRQRRSGWGADQSFIYEHSLARLQDFLCLSSSRRSPSHSKLMVFALWLLEALAGVDWIIWFWLDFLTWMWRQHRISKRINKEDDMLLRFCKGRK